MRGSYRRGPTPPELADGDVHVWVLRRRHGMSDHESVAGVLDRYARAPEHPLTVVHGAGKPLLDGSSLDLRLNVAHAGSALLVGVACGREIGVDVEPLGRGPWLSLPGHVLTGAEQRSLEELAGRARDEAFLRLWVRKEAVLKAAGVGLAVDPALVAVSAAGEPPDVLEVPVAIGPAARWSLVDLELSGHAAAVVVERPHAPIVILEGERSGLRMLTKPLHESDQRLTRAL